MSISTVAVRWVLDRPAVAGAILGRRLGLRDHRADVQPALDHRLKLARRVAGLTLRATDTDWSRGQGPDVTGPIGAILLLLTGRTAALEQLAGQGADALRVTVTRSA